MIMPLVLGVDGCKAGWIGVDYDTSHKIPACWTIYPTFHAVLARLADIEVITVDIPMGFLTGLPGEVTKPAETEVRKFIGARKSSVFASPMRGSLEFATHAEANQHNRSLSGRGLSAQAFGLFPKLREVDRALTPALQQRVFEVHPEACYTALAGTPAQAPKKTPLGQAERTAALERHGMGKAFIDTLSVPKRVAAPDDLIDACLAAVTAHRIVTGHAFRFPQSDIFDERGLRMAIFA